MARRELAYAADDQEPAGPAGEADAAGAASDGAASGSGAVDGGDDGEPAHRDQAGGPEKAGEDADGLRSFIQGLISTEHQPDWLRAMREVAKEEGVEHFGVGLDAVTDSDARRYLYDASKWLQRLGTETGRERAALKAAQTELKAQRAALDERESQLYALFTNPALREALKMPDDEVDPLSPEGIERSSQAAAAKVMEQFLDKLGEVKQASEQEAAASRAEAAKAAEMDGIKSYLADKPEDEVRELWPEVKRLYEATDFEFRECYELIAAKHGKAAPAEPERRPDPREASRRAMGRSRGRSVETPPDGSDPAELVRWMRQNPEAAKALHAKRTSQPNGYAPRR